MKSFQKCIDYKTKRIIKIASVVFDKIVHNIHMGERENLSVLKVGQKERHFHKVIVFLLHDCDKWVCHLKTSSSQYRHTNQCHYKSCSAAPELFCV